MPERTDNIFGLRTPLVFAHRGGALEQPESTHRAFEHALDVPVDVLEIDIQMTADKRIVVWHGPNLDNVYVENLTPSPLGRWFREKRFIHQMSWSEELEGRAYVCDPCFEHQLEEVPREPDRLVMDLQSFLEHYGEHPLNIEIKGTFKEGGQCQLEQNVRTLLGLLRTKATERTVVLSASPSVLGEFREQQELTGGTRFPTGLSWWEALRVHRLDKNVLRGRVLETSHALSTRSSSELMREANGASFPFLTKFGLFDALDRGSPVDKDAIKRLLDLGVDGVMTDRPKEVREVVEEWRHSGEPDPNGDREG